MTGTKRLGKQQQQGVKKKRARVYNYRRRKSPPSLNLPSSSFLAPSVRISIMKKSRSSAMDATAHTIHTALVLKLFLLKKRSGFASLAAEKCHHRSLALKRSSPPMNCCPKAYFRQGKRTWRARSSIVPMRCRSRSRWRPSASRRRLLGMCWEYVIAEVRFV
jgi:hypothetical protein